MWIKNKEDFFNSPPEILNGSDRVHPRVLARPAPCQECFYLFFLFRHRRNGSYRGFPRVRLCWTRAKKVSAFFLFPPRRNGRTRAKRILST
jgi:hypothetical protein